MARKKQSPDPFDGGVSDFVPAVLARSTEEAEAYRALLDDHDIPAIVATDDELGEPADAQQRVARKGGMTQGVPVMVPEVLLDEASEIIADREDDEEFRVDEDVYDDDEDEDEAEQFGLDGEPLDTGEEADGLGLTGDEDNEEDDPAGGPGGPKLPEDDCDNTDDMI